jgi:prolyl oligopeptidase PreP (S9A serine peptidase family)
LRWRKREKSALKKNIVTLTDEERARLRKPKIDFDPDDYEVKQVFYRSKDGTRVPIFVSNRRGKAATASTIG